MNPPLEFYVTAATVDPSKVITTVENGSNPIVDLFSTNTIVFDEWLNSKDPNN